MRVPHQKHPGSLAYRLGMMRAASALLCTVAASCGGSDVTSPDPNDDVPTTPSAVPATPSCAPGEVAINALLDGVSVTDRASYRRYAFQQWRSPATLDIDESPIILHLEWPGLLVFGGSASTRGWSRGAGFDVGNCGAAPFSGTITQDADGDGGRFLLRDLHRAPYCSGPAVRGALAGCWRNGPFP